MSEKHNTKNHKIESIEPMILMSASGADVNGSDSGEILIAFGTGDTINARGGDDTLIGLGGSNVLLGGDGDDRFITVSGDNVVDGGDGHDTLMLLNHDRADFNVIDRGHGIVEISNAQQTNFITNVESVQFGDAIYTVDSLLASGSVPVIVDPANPHIFISENTSFVVDVNATDLDCDTLMYSIADGDDSDLFTIDIETGELSFINPPDFESPLDADGGNTYDVTVVVSDGVNSVSTTLWVTVGNVDENGSTNSAPEFTNVVDGEIVLVKENTTFVGDADATDADADTLSFSISDGVGTPGSGNNEDAGRFEIDAQTGVLTFKIAPDFENPADGDGDNEYHVTIVVSDGTAAQERQVTVRVVDVNESTNSAPQFTNVQAGEIVDVAENTTLVGDANATDVDGDTLTYSISGGTDAAKFTINSATGVVSFVSAPDFEAPTDADGNNLYQLTLRVADGNGGSQEKSVTVRVTDVNEGGAGGNQAPYFTNVYQNENVVVNEGTTFVGDADAFDANGDTLIYSIAGGVDSALFVINPVTGSISFVNAPDFENPADSNSDNFYEVRLRVSDGQASQDRDVLISVDDIAEGANQAPRFTNVQVGDFVYVSENTTFVGDADADGDAYTFSIAGGADGALFTINSQTGIVSFINAPDFENPGDRNGDNSYGVIIRVSDGITYQDRLVWVELVNVAE